MENIKTNLRKLSNYCEIANSAALRLDLQEIENLCIEIDLCNEKVRRECNKKIVCDMIEFYKTL
jgi:hypothetical protein